MSRRRFHRGAIEAAPTGGASAAPGPPASRLLDPTRPGALLPVLAEADPAFARRAPDPRALEAAVRADRSLPPGEAVEQVGYLRSYSYRGSVRWDLARVLMALANNPFGEIGRFLDLPEVYGNWNEFVPRYVFALLRAKEAALRGLTGAGSPRPWTPWS
jgi:hypothetical protein